MTLRWLEGFEGQAQETILGRLYSSVTGTVISVETGHTGFGSALNSSTLKMTTPELTTPDQNTWIMGFAFQVNNATVGLATSQNAIPYVSFRNGSGEQLRLEVLSANSSPAKPGGFYFVLRVMRGATELARTTQVFRATTVAAVAYKMWVYFEWKVVIRTGSNGSFELKYHTFKDKNQTATWSAANTGVNTANQGADGADRCEFSWNSGTDNDPVLFDNIYVFDNQGSKNNDYAGEVHMEAMDVSGNGDTVQWDVEGGAASLEDAWNEGNTVQSTTEDNKVVASNTVSEIELATLSNVASIRTTSVIGVQVRLGGRMETTGDRDVQFFYRKTTGGSAQIGTAIVNFPDTTLRAFADTQEDDPNTGTTWTFTNLDGLQLGVELDA